MKKWLNGKVIEMTAEEIAEFERMAEEIKKRPPTETERLEALERAFMEFVEVVVNG